MDCLYKTSTKFTYEEYKRFNDTIMKRKYIIVATILAVALILIGGILLQNLFLVIFALVYPILFFAAKNIGVKKVFNSNKLLQNADIQFEFYDDHFDIIYEAGNEKVPYDKLSQIIETKTNYYLMIAKNQGFILVKENMSEELQQFLNKKKVLS